MEDKKINHDHACNHCAGHGRIKAGLGKLGFEKCKKCNGTGEQIPNK